MSQPPASSQISGDTLDVLLELVNMGVGLAANTFSELTNRAVTISVPKVELINLDHTPVLSELQLGGLSVLRVSQGFSGDLVGDAMLVINDEGGRRLAEMLLGEGETLNSIDQNAQAALLELGNIVMNGIVGTLANHLEVGVTYEIPVLQLRGVAEFVDLVSDLVDVRDTKVLLMRASLVLSSDKVSGYLMLLLRENSMNDLLARLQKLAA